MEHIKSNIERIFGEIGDRSTQLLAVTKTRSVEEINFAIQCGVRHIGENRVQELMDKYDRLNLEGVSVHLIGQLQTNKVKYIIDKVDLIHSVDSYKLACEISKRALAINRVLDILIEVNVGMEESKAGVSGDELIPLLQQVSELPGVRVRGLMCIPPIASFEHENMKYFLKLKEFAVDIMTKKIDNISVDILSMGMSEDYVDAIAAGSSFIRIGRGIFGPRT